MALDVKAYSGIRKVNARVGLAAEPIEPCTRKRISTPCFLALVHPEYPGRANELEDGAFYTYDSEYHALSINYFTYRLWRNKLAQLAGWPENPQYVGDRVESHVESGRKATSGPFWELLVFSHCEGIFGTAVSGKLAADFERFKAQADQHADEEFRKIYAWLQRAFQLAAVQGAVRFS